MGFGRHRATENTSIYLRADELERISSSCITGIHHRGPFMDPQHLLPGNKCFYLLSHCWKMSLDTAERNRTSASRSDRTAEHQSEKPNTFPNTWLASRYWPELNIMHSQTLLLSRRCSSFTPVPPDNLFPKAVSKLNSVFSCCNKLNIITPNP